MEFKKIFLQTRRFTDYEQKIYYTVTIRVLLGTFESDIMEHPTAHIFVGSKANGDNITDDLPQNGSNKPNS